MKIKTRFYYHDKGKYYEYGGWMVLEDCQIHQLGKLQLEDPRPFYYDDTYYTITYENGVRKGTVDANRIITESHYGKNQREYLTKLGWLQQQKLLWMFRRQWLQQPANMVHLLITCLIVTLAFMSFELIQGKF